MPETYEEYLKQGDNLANQGKLDEALEQYVQARNLAPSRQEARKQVINMAIKKEDFSMVFQEYLHWAGVTQSQGKLDEALKILQDGLSLEGQYEKRGLLLDRRGTMQAKLKEHFSKVASQFYEKLGEIYYEKKDYIAAIQHLDKVIETTPNSTKAHCLLGICYLSKGQLDKAKGPFQEVVRFQGPESPLAYEKLAEIYYSQGNMTQMVIWLKDAAEAYIKKQDWKQAVKALEKILKAEPGNKEVLARLGEIHAKQGNVQEGIRVYKQLAELYSQAGTFDKVIQIYEKLVEWEPENKELVDKVIQIYRDSLRVDRGNLRARIKLIENLLRKGAVEEVVTEYLRLIEDYLKMGLLEDAVRCCEKVLEFDPQNMKARETLAELYVKTGKSEEAGKQLITIVESMQGTEQESKSTELIQKAMGLVSEKSDVQVIMALDLLKRGSFDEALAEFKKVLRDQPDHPEALKQIGNILFSRHEWGEAEKYYLRLLQLDPKLVEIKTKLVELYEAQLIREMEELSYFAG